MNVMDTHRQTHTLHDGIGRACKALRSKNRPTCLYHRNLEMWVRVISQEINETSLGHGWCIKTKQ